MTASNGHDWGKDIAGLSDALRTQAEEVAEIRSYLPGIAQIRSEAIGVKAAVSHLSTDVRLAAAELARLGHRTAETSDAIAALSTTVASLERTVVDAVSALERTVGDLVAHMRRTAQP